MTLSKNQFPSGNKVRNKLRKGKSNTAVLILSNIKVISVKENADEHILSMLQEPASMEKGFRLLMQKYQEQVYWHIRRLVLDHDDANDVVQNVFIKVYRGIDRFEGKSKLFTWLYRIATNEALTFLEQRNRKQTEDIDSPAHAGALQMQADHFFDGDELQARLYRATSLLPDKQKVVFNMRYFEEMSYDEMSEVLQTSVGALKASFHHAVKKIEVYFKS